MWVKKETFFIYGTRRNSEKVDSFFWICHFSSILCFHGFVGFILIKTFVKTNNNLMCDSF